MQKSSEVINIACGERISVNAIIGLINEFCSAQVKSYYPDARPGDVKHPLAAIDKGRGIDKL